MSQGPLWAFLPKPVMQWYKEEEKRPTLSAYFCCLAVNILCQKLEGLHQKSSWSLFFLIHLHELGLEMPDWPDANHVKLFISPDEPSPSPQSSSPSCTRTHVSRHATCFFSSSSSSPFSCQDTLSLLCSKIPFIV